MLNDKNYTTEETCTKSRFGTSLLLLTVGGLVGATVALLFAPKKGTELRADIADAATKGRERMVEAANEAYEQAGEYYADAKEKAHELYDDVATASKQIRSTVGF